MSERDPKFPRPYGRYTLIQNIGQGGMSEIDLARETDQEGKSLRFLIIKRMHSHLTDEDESYIRMFKDEFRISGELRHSKIAQVYTFGNVENEYFMAMEYVQGVDLRVLQKELASQGKGLPIRISLKILVDILDALEFAHNQVDTFGQSMNIVHRDVNPRNVMLSIHGDVKLIDFGVAKAENRMDKTIGHTIKGKFAYMAPEQIDPTVGTVDARSDLFAVGLMMYELIAGKRPFHQLNEVQIMHRILSAEIPNIPKAPDFDHPDLLKEIFNKATCKQQLDRFQSAKEMAEQLKLASQHCGGIASNEDLALFLHTHIPGRVSEIAHRLTQYRNTPEKFNHRSSEDSTTYTGPLYQVTEQSSTLTATEKSSSSPIGQLVLGGVLLFTLAFGTVVAIDQWSASNPVVTTPTQMGSSEQSETKPTQPSTDSQNQILDIDPKPVENISPQKNTPQKQTPRKTLPKKKSVKIDKPTSPEITVESPKLHWVLLLVGTSKGTRDLPVLWNGKEITKTGAKKKVELPIGSHTLEIYHPDTGQRFSQSINVELAQPMITVRFHQL